VCFPYILRAEPEKEEGLDQQVLKLVPLPLLLIAMSLVPMLLVLLVQVLAKLMLLLVNYYTLASVLPS
jgi:hypothetical protein